ncbi:MAG: ATP-dependent Clp protease ATP-binding subunit [bacterium]
MSSQPNNIKYNLCLECNGKGKKDKKQCLRCHGRGLELVIDEHTYYWDLGMSPLQIYQRKAHKFIDKLINFILLILSFLAVLSLFYYLYLIKDADKILNVFLYGESSRSSYLLAIFWAGFLLFLYFFYRLSMESESIGKVDKKKSYAEEVRDEKVFKDKREIEISSSFTEQAVNLVEKIYRMAGGGKEKIFKINPLDILIALMFFEKVKFVFFRLGLDYESLKLEMSKRFSGLDREYADSEYFLKRILLDAYLEAYNGKKEKADVDDILVSLINNEILYPSIFKDGVINDILYSLEVDRNKLYNVIEWIRINDEIFKNWQRFRRKSFFKPKGNMNKAMTAIATSILDQFSQDLTVLAKYGYLSPCIGREKELADIFRIFESGQKGVILTGNPGVGKNAIIEGIAQMMVAEDVPESWQDKRLISLSLARLVSGANPLESIDRLLRAVNEAARSGNIILFIDSIESMIGISAGREGSLDLSEVLTSGMKKYNLIVLATATPMDYAKYIEPSGLIETFTRISIDEPEDNDAIKILEAKTSLIESKDKVFFTYSAIEQALFFSKRFMHDRFLPEKAIDVIEEAGIYVKKKKGKNSLILAEDIAELVSQKTNIPLNKITEKESEKLINLEDKIHERVINQVEAVKAVADSLRRARVEFRDIKRPIANLLFLGPTGVGKTELAKTVAEVYFGLEDSMIRLDMSEYQNKDSLDRLIGAPDNYEVTGLLTEQVRKKPFSLLLLDEIEKAHPDILNLFLQVMDDGRLTDNRGRVIDFTNLIIIATSNAGTAFIQEEIKKNSSMEGIKTALMNRELKLSFRPEFLNRFDEIIVFKPLTMDNVKEIARLMLRSSANRMKEKGIKLEFTDDMIDWISRIGFDPVFGARPLRRAIQENIDTLLAKYLISGKVFRGSRVIIRGGGEVEIE